MITNIDLARSALQADIEQGNDTDAFFGHLSEADLSADEIKETLARMAEAAAKRKTLEAGIVVASVRGVEGLTGSASFEVERSNNLKRLASFLRIG